MVSESIIKGKKIWVCGHNGMVGSSLVRQLSQADCEVLTISKSELDLRNQTQVFAWMNANKPQLVFLCAGKVGGIMANASYPGEFLYDNIMIGSNVVEGARLTGVQKLLYLGSTCIYPKSAEIPIQENALLTGPLEPTNQWMAIAKIATIKLCQAYRKQYGCDYISAQPTNLYGPNDNYNLANSHVLPALLRKSYEAKVDGKKAMTLWGSGEPLREFMYVDDVADALIFLMNNYSGELPVNVGTGEDISIKELAQMINSVTEFEGELSFDPTMPDGAMRKLCDSSTLRNLGWRPSFAMKDGLKITYSDFLARREELGVK